MKILAISKRLEGASLQRLQELQVPEARQVWELLQAGSVREIYFDKERPCAIVVLEADSILHARGIMATLPMAAERQIDFDYYTMGPFAQLSHLFAR